MLQTAPSQADARTFVHGVLGIRYQVTDVARATAFYTGRILLSGPGGRQIQIEDPDGNPLELFEPAR